MDEAERAPYRELDPWEQVLVEVDGGVWPGFATAWQGERVFVRWNRGPGMNHMGTVGASQVRRA